MKELCFKFLSELDGKRDYKHEYKPFCEWEFNDLDITPFHYNNSIICLIENILYYKNIHSQIIIDLLESDNFNDRILALYLTKELIDG